MSIQLINTSDYPVFGFEHKLLVGNPYYIVIAKQSYRLTPEGKVVQLATQQDIRLEDVIEGNPHRSSVVRPSDLIPYKPHPEIILTGSAKRADAKAAWLTAVGLKGLRDNFVETGSKKTYPDWVKGVWVTGACQWEKGMLGWKLSEAIPTTQVSLSYENAFGGSYVLPEDPENTEADPDFPPMLKYADNPSGKGWLPSSQDVKAMTKDSSRGHAKLQKQNLDEQLKVQTNLAAPQLFTVKSNGKPAVKLKKPTDMLPVAGYGSYPNYWQPRMAKVECIAHWPTEEEGGGYPEDFDMTHWQQAPEDQWLPAHPQGGEKLVLTGIFPEGKQVYTLPKSLAHVVLFEPNNFPMKLDMQIDTLFVDADSRILEVVWRRLVLLSDLDPETRAQVSISSMEKARIQLQAQINIEE